MRVRLIMALVVAGALGISFLPVQKEILRLRPSGDPEDRELIGGRVTAEQIVPVPSQKDSAGKESRISLLELRFRPPWPDTGALRVRVSRLHGSDLEKREVTLPFSTVSPDGVLAVRFQALTFAQGDTAVIAVEGLGVSTNSIALATATGVDASFTGALRIGNAVRDRHLALAFSASEPLGRRGLEGLARFTARLRHTDSRAVGRGVLGLAIGFLGFAALRRPPSARAFPFILLASAILSIVLHEPFRTSYPATNDEGSLLMDIQNIRAGYWPFRDVGATKGPLALGMLWPVVSLTGNSLLAARLFVSLLAATEVVLLGVLARRLWGLTAGILAAILYAVTPAVLAQTTQVFLQSFSLPFVTLALLVLANGGRRRELRGGIFFGLAFLARSTSAAFLPFGLLLTLFPPSRAEGETKDPKTHKRLRRVATLIAGFLATVGLAGAAAWPFLGREKTFDFLGWQGVTVGQQRVEKGVATGGLGVLFSDSLPNQARSLIRTANPLLTGALPILLLSLAFLLRRLGGKGILQRIIVAVLFFMLGIVFFRLIPADALAPAAPPLARVVRGSGWLLLFVSALTFLRQPSSAARPFRDIVLLAGTWIALVIGYANFGRFRSHYHAEFLPLYMLAAAAFLYESLGPISIPGSFQRLRLPWNAIRHAPSALLCALTGFLLAMSFPSALRHPHAGNIPLPIAEAVAAELTARTDPGEEIFTAQVLFTFLADRPVPFGISHPGWYREESLGIVPPAMRARYFPDREVLRKYIETKPIRIIVVERRTREVFLEFDPELQSILETRYDRVRTFENPLLDTIEVLELREKPLVTMPIL